MNTKFKLDDSSDVGALVYFDVSIKELFNSKLSKELQSILIDAFNETKQSGVIPYDTGMTQRSFTLKLDGRRDMARLYFDPKKIVGQKRNGYIVKDYYPQYLVRFPQHYTWLDNTIMVFFGALKTNTVELNSKITKKNNITKSNDSSKKLLPLISIVALNSIIGEVKKEIKKNKQKANNEKKARLKRIKELEKQKAKRRSNYDQQ